MTHIGAHWYNRPQTLLQCASDITLFLQLLNQHNSELYNSWFEQAWSKKAALAKPINADTNSIKALLSKKKDGSALPETTFSVSFWNGATDDSDAVLIMFALGSAEPKYWTNNCNLTIPETLPFRKFYSFDKNKVSLINLFTDFWRPNFIKSE